MVLSVSPSWYVQVWCAATRVLMRSIIQHAPGDDQYGYEDAGERWLPVHTVETIVYDVFTGCHLKR
jgi:ubiquitin-conjugating enzyme E2 G1